MNATTSTEALAYERAEGISEVNASAHRIQMAFALATMIIPAFGAIEAFRLQLTGQLTSLEWVMFAVMYFVHMGGVTMGLHRLAAHRSYTTSRWFQALLVLMGQTASQGPVLFWVATHRAHHAYSDTAADPHSPAGFGDGFWNKARGFWHGHMAWMLSRRVANWTHFARDLLRDRLMLRLHQSYVLCVIAGLALPAAVSGYAHHSWHAAFCGFIVGGLARMFWANQAAWCVGSLCHMVGDRRFRTHDDSTNNWFVALFAFGEGLQNNHHAFPSSYRHAMRWWEPDISGVCLYLMSKLGLVWGLKVPSQAAITRAQL